VLPEQPAPQVQLAPLDKKENQEQSELREQLDQKEYKVMMEIP
jgi:hypothetical protein